MHYKPQLPTENNNITPTHPLKELATLILGMGCVILLIYLLLGLMVDIAVRQISPELETELFNHIPVGLLTTSVDSKDPRQQHLQQLTNELKQCAGITTPITVHIQDSETINAVAVPGGHIIIFSALLDLVDTENGLSFVLAHELGHFQNRDHLRGLGRGIVLLTMATTLTGPNSSLTRLVTPTLQLSQAQYSQHRESQADKTGLQTLNCYYGHVGGATDFFTAMAEQEKSSLISHYFGSHPEMQERITALHRLTKTEDYVVSKATPLVFP